MARKTIYVKPENEDLYEKAVNLSDEKSLSALVENAIKKVIEEKGNQFWEALFVKIMEFETDCTDHNKIYFLNRIALDELPDNLLRKAEKTLEIFRFKGFLEDNIWKGPNSEREYNILSEEIDIAEWLDEMYELAISPEFKKNKEEYERRTAKEIEESDLDPETKQQILNKLNKEEGN